MSQRTTPLPTPMTDKRIKRYELLEEVGRGGMAVVYRALDTALEREVAVKVLHPHLASRPESARRFHREARAVARLRHRNIVEIFDTSSEDDGRDQPQFIVTELVDGCTLRDIVERREIDFPCVGVAIALELCDALRHAHAIGIIHRDIKPENVMVARDGAVKLMDFGIAQVLDADRMTASGSLLGSPAHMPPEIIDGGIADFRADIFSLGTVLYFVTANALPFAGNSPTAVLRNIIESRYEAPARRNPRIGRRLAGIIQRCLETDPARRFQTVEALQDALLAELASLDLDDPTELARDYLSAPAAFTERFEPVLVERLLERAQRAVEERDVACAIDWINRVLAYDTGNERALALLDKLGSRRRLKAIALVATICLVLATTGWLLARLAETPRSTDDVTEEVVAAPAPPARAEPADLTPPLPIEDIYVYAHRALRDGFGDGLAAALEALRPVGLALDGARNGVLGIILEPHTDDTVASLDGPRRLAPGPRRVHRTEPRALPEPSSDGATTGAATVEVPKPEPLEPPTVEVVIPVWPPDARGYISPALQVGAVEGDIHLRLPAGRHKVQISSQRCNGKTLTVDVSEAQVRAGKPVEPFGREVTILDWRPGIVRIVEPSTRETRKYDYLYAIEGETGVTQLPEKILRVYVDGFNFSGKAREVQVWAVPAGTILRSLNPEHLSRRYAVKTVAVGPNDTEKISFD